MSGRGEHHQHVAEPGCPVEPVQGDRATAVPAMALVPGRLARTALLVVTLLGAAIPAFLTIGTPPPFLARVELAPVAGTQLPPDALRKAAGRLLARQSLGRAVDLLDLDKDPEFTGGKVTELKVALELLSGEGAEPTDARRKAITHLQNITTVIMGADKAHATLMVRAADTATSLRVAGALATVFAASDEVTGSIPDHRADEAMATVGKAAAALASFRDQVGAENLAKALDFRQRIALLSQQMAAEKAGRDDHARLALAAATLDDVLSGRVTGGSVAPELENLRQIYVSARLDAEQLAVSLGPKHPNLLAARHEAESARLVLAGQLQRAKRTILDAAEVKQKRMSALESARTALEHDLEGLGIDMSAHARLVAAVESAKQSYEAARATPEKTGQARFEASSASAMTQPLQHSLPLRMALGGLFGFGASLAFAMAMRPVRPQDEASQPAQVSLGAMPEDGEFDILTDLDLAGLDLCDPGPIHPEAAPAAFDETFADDGLPRLSDIRQSIRPTAFHRHHVAANGPDAGRGHAWNEALDAGNAPDTDPDITEIREELARLKAQFLKRAAGRI